MGRKERHDVDYFPFLIKDGRTLFILEGKYQCKGTGFFTNLMRFLSRSPDHFFQLATESDRLFFFTTTKCDPEAALDMIEIMVTTGKIDTDLWRQKKVIASQDFLDSIQEAYRNRVNPCITMDLIKERFEITSGSNPQVSELPAEEIPQGPVVSDGINPQRKEKKRKEKKEELPDWIPEKTWEEYLEMRVKIKKPLLEKSFPRVWKELEKLSKAGHPAEGVLDQSIRNSWQGLFEIKKSGGINGTGDFGRTGAPYQAPRRGKDDGAGGLRIPKEYKPEPLPDISEEERQRNLKRLSTIING